MQMLCVIVDNRQIWQNFVNFRSTLIAKNENLAVLARFLAQQNTWTRHMIENHPSDEEEFWRQVAYVMAQYDGIFDGYRATALPEWVR